MVTRRRFVAAAAMTAAATAGCAARPEAAVPGTTTTGKAGTFRHGVASGDPLSDRVILWTRISTDSQAPVPVRWQIAADPGFRQVVNEGVVAALPMRDYTIKVDALGLEPARSYYYRFIALAEESPVGRTRTLPEQTVSRLRIAVASCANLPFGYFNAYGHLATRADLDLVVHLGDYLYEYAPNTYGDGRALGRVHEPPHEIVALSDYRTRHAQYKLDPDLQEAHRQHPWICVWDDHESANNSWRDGAENHNPDQGEGTWAVRRAAAVRAYHEWLPIREQPQAGGPHIYRSFQLGNLATLIMLDTRLHGRSLQVADRQNQGAITDPSRTLLGADQQAWLAEQLRASARRGSGWHVIGQQLMFGQLIGDDGMLLNTDQWDGYPASRDAVFDQLEAERINDTVVLTGDIHTSWGLDLSRDPTGGYQPDSGNGSLAVEFVTTSVTSPGPDGTVDELREREAAMVRDRPHLRYVNLRQQGYLLLDLDTERAQGEWWYVDSLDRRDAAAAFGTGLATARGSNHLVRVDTPSALNAKRPGLA